jgi:hypothetical protein
MNRPVRTGNDSDEARARILEVAEEHFRRVGYHRTSVADIAAELGMSPANIYRFAYGMHNGKEYGGRGGTEQFNACVWRAGQPK